jgi:hypothetical protein
MAVFLPRLSTMALYARQETFLSQAQEGFPSGNAGLMSRDLRTQKGLRFRHRMVGMPKGSGIMQGRGIPKGQGLPISGVSTPKGTARNTARRYKMGPWDEPE